MPIAKPRKTMKRVWALAIFVSSTRTFEWRCAIRETLAVKDTRNVRQVSSVAKRTENCAKSRRLPIPHWKVIVRVCGRFARPEDRRSPKLPLTIVANGSNSGSTGQSVSGRPRLCENVVLIGLESRLNSRSRESLIVATTTARRSRPATMPASRRWCRRFLHRAPPKVATIRATSFTTPSAMRTAVLPSSMRSGASFPALAAV